MVAQKRYFKIGLFVLIGLIVATGLVILFSTSNWFSKTIYIETYFNESVQGLSEGSYVKYRGIDIGRVKKIGFAQQYYPQAAEHSQTSRYIYVLLAINSSFLTHIAPGDVKTEVARQVKKGLRAKLNMQDLTGSSYIELNFMDNPSNYPTLPIYWQPKNAYIPSTASTLSRFTDSVQNILIGLQNVDFKRFFEQGESTMKNTNQLVRHLNEQLSSDQRQLTSTLQNLNAATEQLRHLASDLRQAPGQSLLQSPQALPPKQQ